MLPAVPGSVNRMRGRAPPHQAGFATIGRTRLRRGNGMLDSWIKRWQEGRIGWHEADGSVLLRRHWPRLTRGSRVLVPLCGKTLDMLWLAGQGMAVTGVEISEIAVQDFFTENDLEYRKTTGDGLTRYAATDAPIEIWVGDYMEFGASPFHALYDRGALVAVSVEKRPDYVAHTRRLLEDDAYRLFITLTYDQSAIDGPPWSVPTKEMLGYWPDLVQAQTRNDIERGAPKFREAGLDEVIETVWVPG